ncbi:MAG: endonuclease V [Candidatus Latescibacteria bacterium]|nr:endonuclease V [Candidatus Latescibacterota bacterium]
MKLPYPIHSFDVSIEDAKRIQNELRNLVEIRETVSHIDEVDLVGGVDVAFITSESFSALDSNSKNSLIGLSKPHKNKFGGNKKVAIALAAAVTLDVKKWRVIETTYAAAPAFFPYIPGFLSFREGPAVLKACGELSVLPGVMIYDGCGIAHPRGLGLASHMAVLTGIPSVGCAKSRLCGSCSEPGSARGQWSEVLYHDRIIGTCLRTRDNVRPVYVSPGSGFSIEGAWRFALLSAVKYRLPEPTRLAHNLVTEYKKKLLSKISN